jgi:hypothetical protein
MTEKMYMESMDDDEDGGVNLMEHGGPGAMQKALERSVAVTVSRPWQAVLVQVLLIFDLLPQLLTCRWLCRERHGCWRQEGHFGTQPSLLWSGSLSVVPTRHSSGLPAALCCFCVSATQPAEPGRGAHACRAMAASSRRCCRRARAGSCHRRTTRCTVRGPAAPRRHPRALSNAIGRV